MAIVSVAGIRTFVEGSKGKTVHVGVDVHKRSTSVALLRSDGVWKEWTAPSSPKALESTLLPIRSRIGPVVYEAGPCGFGLARRLIRAGDSRDRGSSQPDPPAGGGHLQDRPAGRSQAGRIRRLGHAPSHCRSHRGGGRVKALKTVSGVGEIVATTFAAEVFRPGRFRRPEEVASYPGLAPVVRQSGGGKTRAKIRPVGQRLLRSLLIEAAWMWKQRDPAAETFYRRILGAPDYRRRQSWRWPESWSSPCGG